MTNDPACLVIGGDSLVGASVVRALEARGRAVLSSSRRKETLSEKRIYLDFESADAFVAPPGLRQAFLIAAATNYDRCEKDPQAKVINVDLIPRLVVSLIEQGVFVTFVSTNSVFGGDRPWPHENDEHAPGIPYARQKSEGEKRILSEVGRLGAAELLNIVRLTKILGANVSPLPAWFAAWSRGEPIEPFSDLIFAPMSVKFVGEALATVGLAAKPGNFHLSGAANITYVDLAHAFADKLGVDKALIRPTTAESKGINIPFKPKYSGLGMLRTTELTGVLPQPLAHLVDDITSDLPK